MADQSTNPPSSTAPISPVFHATHEEVRLATLVAEVCGPLHVQPLNSRMGPPPPGPAVPKASKGKTSKDLPPSMK
ncbi:hypothetical protein LIER_29442 [Lithospermum erythrorhizon]|uniref:Uncharacterized protein n=1 Tax=Lithospermum erythrorhizon TaxID=34254 RepID=A0AAV3RMI5_LITER